MTLSTTAGSLESATATDNNDGTYTGTLTSSTTVETATITGKLDGNAITDDATVKFVAIDIAVDKSVSDSTPEEGSQITYTIVVTNDGPADATSVVVTDALPPGVEYVSDNGGTTGSVDRSSAPTIVWNVGDLADDATATLVIAVDVTGDAGEVVMNVATKTGVDQLDVDTSNDSDDANLTIQDRLPTISVEKKASPTAVQEPGGDVTFTVTVTNTSPESVWLFYLVDDIHGDLNGQGSCSLVQQIAAGGIYECSFTAAVNGDAGESETDTVEAKAVDNENAADAIAFDSATVGINPIPPIEHDPTAHISSPGSLDTFLTTASIAFRGTGDDDEDGNLLGNSLVWISDRDGELGKGVSLDRSLTAGHHVITLVATDSTSRTGIAIVTVTVNAPPEPPVTPPGIDSAKTTITADPTEITADGSSTSTITVQLVNTDGDNLTIGGATVTLSTDAGLLTGVTDKGDGIYTATLTSSTTPDTTATISGTVNTVAITDTATVLFSGGGVSGGASGTTTIITADPEEIAADGSSTSTIKVVLRDIDNNILDKGGPVVTLETTEGSLSDVTDNGDGEYTATLTSSSTPGIATITGKLDGTDIEDDATVEFTPVITVTETNPIANIDSPEDGDPFLTTDSIQFNGSGVDAEDGFLTGASLVWTSNMDGEIGTGESFTSSLTAGEHVITLTVTDRDGGEGTDSVTIVVGKPPSTPTPTISNPTASITMPQDGADFLTTDDSIQFSGSGNDPEDGALSGSALRWTSSIAGEIGTGESFTRPLGAGEHVITLTVTDSDGGTGTDSVSVTVSDPPPPPESGAELPLLWLLLILLAVIAALAAAIYYDVRRRTGQFA